MVFKPIQELCGVFDDWADHYGADREKTPYFRAQLAIVLGMLAKEKGTILAAGCAAGGEFPELRARKFDIVGIDLSARMLEFTHRRFAAEIPFEPHPSERPRARGKMRGNNRHRGTRARGISRPAIEPEPPNP